MTILLDQAKSLAQMYLLKLSQLSPSCFLLHATSFPLKHKTGTLRWSQELKASWTSILNCYTSNSEKIIIISPCNKINKGGKIYIVFIPIRIGFCRTKAANYISLHIERDPNVITGTLENKKLRLILYLISLFNQCIEITTCLIDQSFK